MIINPKELTKITRKVLDANAEEFLKSILPTIENKLLDEAAKGMSKVYISEGNRTFSPFSPFEAENNKDKFNNWMHNSEFRTTLIKYLTDAGYRVDMSYEFQTTMTISWDDK